MWIAIVVLVALVGMFVGLASSAPFPRCCECKAPMPDGFWATTDKGHICRTCGRKNKVQAWYEKPAMLTAFAANHDYPESC
jgi:hypothetical protein